MSNDLALDFGSSTTRVADARGSLLVEEPTVAAVDTDSGRLIAFGARAVALGAATAGRVAVVHPVRHGQIVDIALAEDVLAEVVRSAGLSRLAHPRILACVASSATHVQRRALDRALRHAGARQVRFLEQPVACAIGAGLPIEEPSGSMVVDVGAGTTDIGVLALGGLVTSASLPIGGDDFDEAVRLLLARRYRLVVEHATAAEVRRLIGSVRPGAQRDNLEVTGRDGATGLPRSIVVSVGDVSPVLEDLVARVLDAAVQCIATAPPDLANDLLGTGCHLSGGGSLLDGLDHRLATATGLAVRVARDPARSAIYGAGQCLQMFDAPGAALSAAPRR